MARAKAWFPWCNDDVLQSTTLFDWNAGNTEKDYWIRLQMEVLLLKMGKTLYK